MKTKIQAAPAGHLEATGFLLVAPGGWLTQDGLFTRLWYDRGAWDTPKAAEEALEKFVAEGKVES